MDELTSKLKTGLANLFGKNDEEKWKDKGRGQKLGSADPAAAQKRHPAASSTQASAPRPQGAAGPSPVPTPPQPLVAASERSSRSSQQSTQAPAQTQPVLPNTLGPHAHATDSVQHAVLGSVVMVNTPTGAERQALGAHLAPGGLAPSGSSREDNIHLLGVEGHLNTPTAAERNLGLGAKPNNEGDFHLRQLLQLVTSQDQGAACVSLAILYKLLKNVLDNPGQPKYRSVRLNNPSIESAVVGVRGAMEFLQAVGYLAEFKPAAAARQSATAGLSPTQPAAAGAAAGGESAFMLDGGSGSQQFMDAAGQGAEEDVDGPLEGYLVLPDEAPLQPLSSGLQELVCVMTAMGMDVPGIQPSQQPTPRQSSSPQASPQTQSHSPPSQQSPNPRQAHVTGGSRLSAAQYQAPVDRQTQVVLPVAPDTQVPDWFYERTGVELKAEVTALAKRRAAGEVLMTKAWRERVAAAERASSGGGAAEAPTVTIRVRFQEGVCLQGCFGPREPVTRIFEWVTESLRYMEISYELITPSRKPLPATGQLRDHPDLQGAALLNFRTLGGHLDAYSNVPMLSDALLKMTHAE